MRGISQYPRRPPSVQLGLRLQIILALAGLMLLAFVPMFFAVASLTGATVAGAREHAARALARTIAAQAAAAKARGTPTEIEDLVHGAFEAGGVDAACVFAHDGSRATCAGEASDIEAVSAAVPPDGERASVVRGAGGRAVEVRTTLGDVHVVTRTRLGDAAYLGTPLARLVRLVALYMITFGLALLVFAYFVLTRLIVRPVERLVDAADRVASGARTLRVRPSGARELIELGASVQAMAEKLISEEAALILKVEELTATTTRLRDTQSQLVRSERLASVGRLAAGVAHEIGNPLTALMGMEDLLLDGQLPLQTQRDFLERMRRETQRIHTVVRDLLDFARPDERAPVEGAPAAADVGGVVDDVVALVRPQKAFRAVHIETDVPDALRVALPSARLTQVLLNVVLNAGAAIASAGRSDGRVVIRARSEHGRARIEVEDDGPGISPDIGDRLFEPFATTKEVGEGTGLGLAVCRGLVESAGGEIGLDASYLPGARFYVVLPVADSS